ncbi:MAG: hypothetical protein NZ700_08210 [Gemmataceae bacterium]|nr:hypothetical protein [Gemmataceae bacterium]MDW8264389.1 hypothetical protein [Gemmataceae bacterium]
MPIRFRCSYCNQLMGIARRKAGTVVRCPSCHGELVVPQPDDEAPPPPKPHHAGGSPPTSANPFEQSDFDRVLEVPRPGPAPDKTAGVAPRPDDRPAAGAAINVERLSPEELQKLAANRPGILLTPRRAAVLGVLVVLLLAGAFLGGVFVGWWLAVGPQADGHAAPMPSLPAGPA